MFNHENEHEDERMMLIQANLDDMNPEWTSYISDRLFEVGANDVYWIPIIMKKGRPGIMLNVLVHASKQDPVENVIFSETTTLGLRFMHATCHRLGRQFVDVSTKWGTVQVKAGFRDGQLIQYAPEFKQCEAIALAHKVPIKQVYDEVKRVFLNQGQDG
jgi:pyridinium-3,5-bisthiocarboxylic acid mononucleotide nickel chelatase